MSWFKRWHSLALSRMHHHYWRPKTALNTILNPGSGQVQGGLLIEDCHCGAVRAIEFYPGKAPIVRITQSEEVEHG